MILRRASGFTIVELIVITVVIAILTSITIAVYNGVQTRATEKTVQSNLTHVAIEMASAFAKEAVYPSTLPATSSPSKGVTLTLQDSRTSEFYEPLTEVQNGVLFAKVCQDLIDEGVGQGTNSNGGVENYVSGCGNLTSTFVQISGWESKGWTIPVAEEALKAYADAFVNNNSATYHPEFDETVKEFYYTIIDRFRQEGGRFPITSFWDTWAAPENSGVEYEELPVPRMTPQYCIEAFHSLDPNNIWRITEENLPQSGPC